MADKLFATELWDQFVPLTRRIDEAKTYSIEVANFFAKRAALEKEYAQKLQKLVKQSAHIADVGTSLDAGWQTILQETGNISKWHNDFADQLMTEVNQPVLNFYKDSMKQRKTIKDKGDNLIKQLTASSVNRDKARTAFEQSRQKQDDAQAEYDKANYTSQPPATLSKLAKKVQAAGKLSVKLDDKYKSTVEALLDSQKKMYDTDMPQLLSEMQTFEESRQKLVKDVLVKFIGLQTGFSGFLTDHCATMQNSADAINIEGDTTAYVNKVAKHEQKPNYAEYEPYDPQSRKCVAGSGGNNLGLSASDYGEGESSPKRKTPKKEAKGVVVPSKMQVHNSPSRGSGPVEASEECLVRALFDYNGETENELSFKKGDIIKITEKHESGWWEGDLNGVRGAFPSQGWVEEIKPGAQSVPNGHAEAAPPPPSRDAEKTCTAAYDYAPEDGDEVEMKVGDTMTIASTDSGWNYGTNKRTGLSGRYPANYVN